MAPHNPLNLLDINEITSCAADLGRLAPDTELEFLNIGEMLHGLANLCSSMTEDTVQLTAASNYSGDSSENEGSFIEETRGLFQEVADHVQNSLSSVNEGENLLTELLSQLQKLRVPIQKLHSIGKTFRVLGISIKVESSRNQKATEGFQLLAEEVAEIASSVQDNCSRCNEKADVVEQDIVASKEALRKNHGAHDVQGESAIQNILNTLEDVGNKSEMLAAELQERSTVMTQGIGDVVMAMQFHDISRQQLENVSHALVRLSENAQTLSDDKTKEKNEQFALEAYGVLSIQTAHLNSIYEQIMKARNQIETGLEKTTEQARLQTQDARALLEIEGRTGNRSIVTNLESEIDNIVVSLNKSLEVVKNAGDVSRNVFENVSVIGEFVNSIEEIAFDVKILAINAMVEALKTGETGRTLSVLAKELSNLSLETKDEVSNSIEMLQSIIAGTEKQLEFSVNLDRDKDTVDSMIQRAKTLTATILSSVQQVSSLAMKMDGSNRDLAGRINQMIPEIKFPSVMGDRIDGNWKILCQIINRIEEAYPQFVVQNQEVEQMLEKLTEQYVMDRERSIHAQVAGKNSPAAISGELELFEDDGIEFFDNDFESEQSVEGTSENDEFGENVELF